MAQPPRPDKPPRPFVAPSPAPVNDTEPIAAPAPAELDADTRAELADVIAQAIAKQLGHVRVSSIPPKSEPPRSSIRVAANVGGKVGKWGIKWGVLGSGALALVGQIIVWTMKPEYAAPLGQAIKLIMGVIVHAIVSAMGQDPAAEPPPEARDVPALVAPSPDASP